MCSGHMIRQRTAALVGAVAVLTLVGLLTGGVGASPTADSTSPHGAENGNYTVDLPFDTDHYPRDENPGGPYNASINQFAAGTQKSYNEQGAPDGLEQMKYLRIENQDIDFSECTSSNTAAFGIDRDNDDAGTEVDIDLLRYLEQSNFNDHSIEVDFYEGNELGAPNPPDRGGREAGREDGDSNAELYPDDEIVSHQGYKSGGGPCYGMPEEPGWYQIEGFTNGTAWSGNEARIETISHYFYICVCGSEAETREQLGPPPSEQGDDDTAESTATATPMPDDSDGAERTATRTPTETATETPTETPTAEPDDGGGDDSDSGDGGGSDSSDSGDSDDGGSDGDSASQETATATAGGSNDGGRTSQQDQRQQAQQQGAGPATPTVGAGPGFGAVAALAGGLLAGLLALLRR